MSKTIKDNVNQPSHYQIKNGLEVFDVIDSIIKSQCENVDPRLIYYWSNVTKYILRMWSKNGLEDAKKARWYLDKMLSLNCDDESKEPKNKITRRKEEYTTHNFDLVIKASSRGFVINRIDYITSCLQSFRIKYIIIWDTTGKFIDTIECQAILGDTLHIATFLQNVQQYILRNYLNYTKDYDGFDDILTIEIVRQHADYRMIVEYNES